MYLLHLHLQHLRNIYHHLLLLFQLLKNIYHLLLLLLSLYLMTMAQWTTMTTMQKKNICHLHQHLKSICPLLLHHHHQLLRNIYHHQHLLLPLLLKSIYHHHLLLLPLLLKSIYHHLLLLLQSQLLKNMAHPLPLHLHLKNIP